MSRLNDEKLHRLEKLKLLREKGIEPYPSKTSRSHTIAEALLNFNGLESKEEAIILAGRLKTIRTHGGMTFAHLEDGAEKMQIVLRRDRVGRENYELFQKTIDLGDFIEAEGKLFTTKKSEKSLDVQNFTVLAKALLPLPEKWHGLSDIEIRFRKRYLDLISNPSVRHIFRKRSLIIAAIRKFLESNDFLEVETPILQPIPGGALAKPFLTHHNALDTDLYLRVAPELYLKRLVVGGYEKVFEISRCFRNEGIDHLHNPEFTQVEFYCAYTGYEELMKFTEKMFVYLIEDIEKKFKIQYEKNEIDFSAPFKRILFKEAMMKYGQIDIEKIKSRDEIAEKAEKLGIKILPSDSFGRIIDEIFKKCVRPQIIQPTFVYDYPVELSPLAKTKAENSKYAERFQLIAAGIELCNAYSELNDPQEQEKRFREQEKIRKGGEEEAQRMDKDFIEALSYGMPPTAGFGMGIDRLAMLLTDTHNIKEVILFPTMRNK